MLLQVLPLLLATVAFAYPNNAPNARLPTLGWSSWIALGPGAEHAIFDYCDEASVMAAADAFVEVGLYAAGYRHFHLDDCWAGTERNATGYLMADPQRFPNGMAPVVAYVHSKGLSFGLYTCSGTLTCVGGRQGSYGHWEQDAAYFAEELQVDWVKQDYCNVPTQYKNNPQPLYTNMSQALNATGRPIAFNMCEWGLADPWTWGNGVAQSWRIAGDHTGVWDSTKSVIRSSAAVPAQYSGRPYGWNDVSGCVLLRVPAVRTLSPPPHYPSPFPPGEE